MVTAAGLFLTPGSGGLADHRTLLDLDEAMTAAGVAVRRYDFEYRRQGKRSPGRADRLIGELRDAVTAFADELGVSTSAIVAGGRSMGGRVASMAAAEGLDLAGLLLLSYPLHPPGKPDRLRVDHWPSIAAPCLFISSDSDPFGVPAEFDEHLSLLLGDSETLWLQGGAHDPKRVDHRAAIVASVAEWMGVAQTDV